MKAIRGWTSAVLGALLGGSVALGQSSSSLPTPSTSSPPIVTITTEPLATSPGYRNPWNGSSSAMPVTSTSLLGPTTDPGNDAPPAHTGTPVIANPGPIEAWLNHNGPGCCGPVGGHGAITYDLYFRTGFSFPVGGGTISQSLNTGWMFRGGARTLFFDPQGSSAWLIDTHLDYTYNSGKANKPLAFFGLPTTLSSLSRWNVGLGLGKEWYTNGPGFVTPNANWTNMSYGFDVGGRWGTTSAHYNLTRGVRGLMREREYDVTGGLFGGLNLNYEFPMGGWTFLLGGRLEGAMTFTDVLRGYGGTLYDVNLLLSAGVRY